jgi:hypothetical protein
MINQRNLKIFSSFRNKSLMPLNYFVRKRNFLKRRLTGIKGLLLNLITHVGISCEEGRKLMRIVDLIKDIENEWHIENTKYGILTRKKYNNIEQAQYDTGVSTQNEYVKHFNINDNE